MRNAKPAIKHKPSKDKGRHTDGPHDTTLLENYFFASFFAGSFLASSFFAGAPLAASAPAGAAAAPAAPGAAAAAAPSAPGAAAAAAVGSGSSARGLWIATTAASSFASSTSTTPSGTLSCDKCTLSLSESPEISTSIYSGRSFGKQEISTSLRICETMPP